MFRACQLAGMFAPVARHDLILSALTGADNGGREDPICPDALHGLLHRAILTDLEGLVGEGMQL